MKLKAEYIFDADLDRTIDVCVNKTIGNEAYFKETMRNVSSVKLLERVDHPDGRIHVKMEFCAHGQIPRALRHIVKPEMLTWREISTWDPKAKRYVYEIKTRYMTNLVVCRGWWSYASRGPNRTAQFCEGELTIRIPIFGPMIEKAVWPVLKKNWDESYEIMKKKHNI